MAYEIIDVLEEIMQIHKQYGNEVEAQRCRALLTEMQGFRVRVPVIGKFSAGKSTLINTMLGYSKPLLMEDILPETAVPTELSYGETAEIFLHPKNGQPHPINIEQFRAQEWDAEQLEKIRMTLPHEQLARMPQVDLVDMPGFGSGYEAHNRVLDEYLPNSSAYVLVFNMDDAVLKGDMAAILKELEMRQSGQPMCAVLTRANDRAPEIIQEIRDHLEASLEKQVGRKLPIYCTDRDLPNSADALWDFLYDLQQNHAALMQARYAAPVQSELEGVYLYLNSRMHDLGMDEETRRVQRERIEQEMTRLERDTEKQIGELRAYVPSCRDLILQDVMRKLQGKKASYVQMIMSRRSVEDTINKDARAAVIQGVSKHFDPKMSAYLQRIETNIKTTVASLDIGAMETRAAGDSALTGTLAGVAAGSVVSWASTSSLVTGALASSALAGFVGTISSSVISIAIPVVGIAIGAIIGMFHYSNKKKEMQREVEQNLETQVFPQILRQLESTLGKALSEAAEAAAQKVQDEIRSKRSALEQSLEERKGADRVEIEAERTQIQQHLNKLEELCNAE